MAELTVYTPQQADEIAQLRSKLQQAEIERDLAKGNLVIANKEIEDRDKMRAALQQRVDALEQEKSRLDTLYECLHVAEACNAKDVAKEIERLIDKEIERNFVCYERKQTWQMR